MKKLIIILAIVLMPVWASAGLVEDQLAQTWTEKEQREKCFQGRALLEAVTQILDQNVVEFQELKDSGEFNTLPAELKAVLYQWFEILKNARTAIGTNGNIMDIYGWRPSE